MICNRKVHLKLEGKFYRTITRHAKLYASECWAIKSQHESKFGVTDIRILCWMSGFTGKIESEIQLLERKLG